ncbi:MAG: MFS transporter [Leptospiraceae bacterium]
MSIHREGPTILLLGLAIVLVVMNTMMFNLALPSVADQFGLDPAATSWIVTAYSITFAIAAITYSRLSDFIPIRRLFIVGLLFLSIAAFAGFFSNSFLFLLLARIFQAVGGGSIPGLALVLLSRYIPLERRGRAMAIVMASFAVGLGLGPIVGGAIVEYLGWNYLFLLTASTGLLIPFFKSEIPAEKAGVGSFDFFGAALASIGITSLLLAMTESSIIALCVSIGAFPIFWWRIQNTRSPFVMPSLLKSSTYLTLVSTGLGGHICTFAMLYLMPQILVDHYHLTAMEAGLVIFPGSFASMIVSPVVGRMIDGIGNRHILEFAPVVLLVATVLFTFLAGTSFFYILLIFILMSIAFTFLTSSVSNEISRVLNSEQLGSGMGLFQLMQFFSGAFSIAATATGLSMRSKFPPEPAYGFIFWGMSVILTVSIFAASFYLRRTTDKSRDIVKS